MIVKLIRYDMETILEKEYNTKMEFIMSHEGYNFYSSNKQIYWDSKNNKVTSTTEKNGLYIYMEKEDKYLNVSYVENINKDIGIERIKGVSKEKLDAYFTGVNFYSEIERRKEQKIKNDIEDKKRAELKKQKEIEFDKEIDNVKEMLLSDESYTIKDCSLIVEVAKRNGIKIHPQIQKTFTDRISNLVIENKKVVCFDTYRGMKLSSIQQTINNIVEAL